MAAALLSKGFHVFQSHVCHVPSVVAGTPCAIENNSNTQLTHMFPSDCRRFKVINSDVSHVRAEAVRCAGLLCMLGDSFQADASGCAQRIALLRTALLTDPRPRVCEAAARALCDLAVLRYAHRVFQHQLNSWCFSWGRERVGNRVLFAVASSGSHTPYVHSTGYLSESVSLSEW